jgi:5-bromo-4-chloroindolyl phosphate hydrolysis protein
MSMSDDGKLTPITVAGSTGGYTYKYTYVHRYSISNTTYGVTSEGRVIKVKDDGKGNIEEVEITDKDTKNIVLALHAVKEATKRHEHLGIENYFKSLGEISTDDDAAKVADYVYGGEVEIDGKTYKATSALLNMSPVIVQIDGNYFVVSKFAGKNIVRKLEDIQDLIDEVRENVIKPLKAYNLKRKSGPIDPGKPRGKGGTDPIIPPLEPGKGTNPFEDLTRENVFEKIDSSTDSSVKEVLSIVSAIEVTKQKHVIEFLKKHGAPTDIDAFRSYIDKINTSKTIKQVKNIITQMENDKSCYGLL